jgi:hypothetical protein
VNRAIELHDSTLHGIVTSGVDRVIQFRPAYVHESSGVPGRDPGKGYTQDIDVVLGNARVISIPASLPAVIWDGRLIVGGVAFPNTIALPLVGSGGVSLSATTSGGDSFQIDADSISTAERGVSTFVESFPGSTDV